MRIAKPALLLLLSSTCIAAIGDNESCGAVRFDADSGVFEDCRRHVLRARGVVGC